MKPIDVVRSSRKSKDYLEYKEITSKYSRPEEMNKDYPYVYKNIKIRHWNELIRHFDMRTNNKYKFSIENLEEFIDECVEMGLTRNDVKRMYPKPAQYIRTHRLTDLFLKLPLDNDKIKHSYDRKCGIYAYEFFINDEKYVYVGLTCDFKRRDIEHRKEVHGKTTTVYKFAESNHIDIPKIKIIIDYEDTLSAIKDEGEVLNNYVFNGWIQLNVEKTGGIGAPSHYGKDRLPIDSYNKELCQQIIKERGYTNRWQIRETEYNMANWIEQNNLWDELMPIINYSFEDCLVDALKYDNYSEWARLSPSKAHWAQKRKWNTIIN